MFDTEWYNLLIKPPLTPPAQIFGPAWIILYLTIFVSLILFTTKRGGQDKVNGYIYFIIQLLLNIIWTPLFFMQKNAGLAFIDIVLLDIFVFLTVKEFYKTSKASAIILIPYFLWVLFATYLNGGILFLN